MSQYKLSARSKKNLLGIDRGLYQVVCLAIKLTKIDFGVTEGIRTPERQQHLFDIGASQTLNSNHLTGHAVDLVAYDEDGVSWSWPLYHQIALAMKEAAEQLGVPITWGGDWKNFKDGPHFETNYG